MKAKLSNLVIDIETLVIPPTPEEIEEARTSWQPKGNVKDPDKIEAQKQRFFANVEQGLIEERRFSLGGKRMISCAIGEVKGFKVENIQSWASDDLSEITRGIASYFDAYDGFRLIGWNHIAFDLPEIAKSFIRTRVMPRNKPAKWDVIDLCKHPFNYTKLKDAAKAFNMKLLDVNGSDVQRLYDEGDWAKIKEYNEHDVRLTGQLFAAANTIFSF